MCLLLLLGLTASARADDATKEPYIDFDIPQQRADLALTEFADQADLTLIVPHKLVEGKTANELVGPYLLQDGIDILLAGTGLSPEISNHVVLSIVAEDRSAVLGETMNFERKTGLLAALASVFATGADAQEGDTVRDEIEEIVVIGTSIRGVAPAGSPVLVFDRETIQSTGLGTIQDFMRTLPQNFGGGPNDITSAATVSTANDANVNSSRGVGVNLRGLGTQSTLTLVNGRRLMTDASDTFADVSIIPIGAIERVEILTDGASAIYGSDAVGGVVNFVFLEDYQGAETRLRYGTVTDGGQQEVSFSQNFGKSWSGGNLTLAYGFVDRDPLFSSERSFAATSNLTGLGGDDFRQARQATPGNIIAAGQSFAIPAGQDGTDLSVVDLVAGTENLGDLRTGTTLLEERRQHSLYISAHQNATERLRFYFEGRYADRAVTQINIAESERVTVPSTNPFFVDPVGGLDSIDVDYNFINELGNPTSGRDTEAMSATFGADMSIGESWMLKAHGSYSNEDFDFSGSNRLNTFALDQAIADGNPVTAFNVFGDGSNTNSATIESARGFSNSFSDTDLVLFNATADGDLFSLPAGPVQAALGAEYFEWQTKSGHTQLLSSPAPISTTTVSLERDVLSGFAEIRVPFVSADQNISGVQSLDMSVAGRYSDYSDFGTTFDPKIGISWVPFDRFTLRGSLGTSFRAPSLRLLDDSFNNAIFWGRPDPSAVDGITDALILFGNNPDLKPEEADTWTVGFDWSPPNMQLLNLSVTYFNIEYRERIASGLPFFLNLFADADFLEPLIDRAPNLSVAQAILDDPTTLNLVGSSAAEDVEAIVDLRSTNVSVTELDGLDLSARYGIDTSFGRLDFGLNASIYIGLEEAFTAAADFESFLGQVGRPADYRVRLNGSWQDGPYSVGVFINHVDSYSDTGSEPDRRVDSYTTMDLRVSYSVDSSNRDGLMSGATVALSVQNLFDEDPPFLNNPFGIGFDPEKANPQGRFIALELTKGW